MHSACACAFLNISIHLMFLESSVLTETCLIGDKSSADTYHAHLCNHFSGKKNVCENGNKCNSLNQLSVRVLYMTSLLHCNSSEPSMYICIAHTPNKNLDFSSLQTGSLHDTHYDLLGPSYNAAESSCPYYDQD